MSVSEFFNDIIINSPDDIDKINKLNDTINNIQLLYINTKLTRVQLKHVCNILNPQHIIFRQKSNNANKSQSESVVLSIPFDSINNTIFPSSVNRMTFYWNRNRPLTKNIYPSWIYEMYNNIFHNIESLNKLSITKSHIKSKSSKRINSNKTTKGIHK
jgi:hypothetical protein